MRLLLEFLAGNTKSKASGGKDFAVPSLFLTQGSAVSDSILGLESRSTLDKTIFIITTQPSLAVDLLHVCAHDFITQLSERLKASPKLAAVARLNRTFINLSFLMANLGEW
jgi:hypothetical protein